MPTPCEPSWLPPWSVGASRCSRRHPHKIRIGDNVVIDDQCCLDAKGTDNTGIVIGQGVFVGRNTILSCKNGDIVLADRANIGFNCEIFSASRVSVGPDTLVAAYSYLVGGDHEVTDRTRGVLRVETGSGNVDLRTASGDVALHTGSGDVTVSGMLGTRLSLETGSGNVTLTDGKAGTLQVETGSGDIEVTGASGDEVSFGTGSGNIDVALVTTFQSLRVETGSGDVTLRVPPMVGAEVDLQTGSGDIDLGGLTLQVRRIEQHHVRGTLGDGKGRLSVDTGSGNVRLLKL